jgi:hypothetical protein
LLLVGQRPQRVFSLLAPHTQPKSAAALLYELRLGALVYGRIHVTRAACGSASNVLSKRQRVERLDMLFQCQSGSDRLAEDPF